LVRSDVNPQVQTSGLVHVVHKAKFFGHHSFSVWPTAGSHLRCPN